MFGFGMPEMIIILILVLLVFGAGKLPEVGNALGKGIRNFKDATDGRDALELNPAPGENSQQAEQKTGKDGAASKQG